MALHQIFKLRDLPTDGILRLLESVTLGTNGAKYTHLDTREKIAEADNPLFLSMERNEKVMGNITFCRRAENWYIRYFAFDQMIQSGGQKRAKGEGMLKQNIELFFQEAFNGAYGNRVHHFYAYIDPKNSKSLWMSEQFRFNTVGKIATQSFSRANPKTKCTIEKSLNWNDIKELVEEQYQDYTFYSTVQTSKPPFYIHRDAEGNIRAFAKMNEAHWRIDRLPGKFGSAQVKLIPYIPFLRKIIKPESHDFLVPEAIYIKDNDNALFSDFLESILAMEDRNLMLWWVDEKDRLYSGIRSKINWGLLHRLIGVPTANVVVRSSADAEPVSAQSPFYTSGFDFI